MRRLAFILIAALATACSSSEAPSPSMTGAWAAVWPNMTDGSTTCTLSDTLNITQSSSTFTGRYAGATAVCNGQSATGGTGAIVHGTVNGTSITFDLDTTSLHQTGTFNASGASGQAVWSFGGITLNGTWSATR